MSRKTRKFMWSVPLVAVVAAIGALALFVTQTPSGIFADSLADAPQNLMVEPASGNSGRTNLVLTWEAPASGAPDMYRIDVSIDGDKWSPEAEVAGNMLTYTDDLSSAVDSAIDGADDAPVSITRYYRVFAVNFHGSGQVSTSESASTKNVGRPGAVDAFVASPNGPEMIELSWTVPDDGGSDILGYCILAWSEEAGDTGTIGTVSDTNCKDMLFSSGPGSSDATSGDATTGLVIRIAPGSSYTHKSLRAGQTWNYTAYAVNKYGQSQTASNTRQVKTASANVPPAPGNLLIRRVAGGTNVVNLYWTVDGDGGQDISAYRVEVSDTPNNWPDDGTALPAAGTRTDTSTTLDYNTGLTSGKRTAVINVPRANATPDPFELQHTVAVGAGDLPATFTVYYRVRVETGTGGGARMSAYTQGSITLTDTASPSDYAHDATNPNAPVVAHNNPVGGTPDDDTVPGEIKLTVTRSTLGGSSDYRVDISDDDGETWTMVHRSTRPINETEYQHQGLKPNTERHFRLFTKNGSNFGLASAIVEDTSGHSMPPDSVGNLAAAKNGAGEIKVSWTAPSDDNGAMVDKYCVVMNQIDDNNAAVGTAVSRTNIAVSGADANCTRYGLPDLYTGKASITGSNRIIDVDADLTMITARVPQQTRWQFQVYALNGATETATPDTHNGLATTSETVHDKTTAGMKPNMPRNLTAELARDTNLSGVGNQGVLLLWNQPAAMPGAPVNSYKVERMVDDGDYEVLASNSTGTRTYYVDTDEPGMDEMRTYRVTAINIAGTGTDMASVMIPYPPEMHSHATVLTAPMNVVATSTVARQLDLTWTGGDNADLFILVAYDVDTGDLQLSTVTDGTARSGNVTGLTTGSEYLGLVIAVKGSGANLETLYDYDRTNPITTSE